MAHGLKISVNRLFRRVYDAMCQAYIQFSHIVPVKALAHLLPCQLCKANKDGAARLPIQTVTKAIILILVEQVGVGLAI